MGSPGPTAQGERDALRGELRLVTAERDLAEERLRTYKRELFGALSETRDSDQPGLFNEAEALAPNAEAAWPARTYRPHRLQAIPAANAVANHPTQGYHAK